MVTVVTECVSPRDSCESAGNQLFFVLHSILLPHALTAVIRFRRQIEREEL